MNLPLSASVNRSMTPRIPLTLSSGLMPPRGPILVFLFSWNEFLYALTFTSTGASRAVPVAIALFPGIHEKPWGEIAAASIVVTLPLVFFAFACQKRIVEGLTAGALKE
jgi:multiple sugar transport system permease protein